MRRRDLTAAFGVAILLGLTGCASAEDLAGGSGKESSGPVIVGSANFPENVLLAHIYARALEGAGIKTEVKPNIGSREVLIPALKDGSVDILPEYAGALLAFLDKDADDVYASEEVLAALKTRIPDGLSVLDASEAEDKDAFVVTKATAAKYKLVSVGDLKPVAGQLVLGGPPETKDRRAGIPGLKDLYGVTFGEFKSVDLGGPLTIGGLKSGDIDVGLMFTTQPAISENGFVVLEDPNYIALAENVLPLLRSDRVDDKARAALNAVSAALTTEGLIEMNRRVELDKADPAKVAQEFVDRLG